MPKNFQMFKSFEFQATTITFLSKRKRLLPKPCNCKSKKIVFPSLM